MKKPIEQLIPDLKRGLQNATELAASEITLELKALGPYYTGQFEAAWVIERGQVSISPDKADQLEKKKVGETNSGNNIYKWYLNGKLIEEAEQREITAFSIEPATDLRGYTIGNEMEYAMQAMDLVEGIRTNASDASLTAERDWFVKYVKGGPMMTTLSRSVRLSLRAEGF